jgi:hypothetical protein
VALNTFRALSSPKNKFSKLKINTSTKRDEKKRKRKRKIPETLLASEYVIGFRIATRNFLFARPTLYQLFYQIITFFLLPPLSSTPLFSTSLGFSKLGVG